MKGNEQEYIAFISYRHKPLDIRTARWVEKQIEYFTIPGELQKGSKKLGRVFRDEDELPLSSDLSDSILYALDHSKFLIVICTPDLPLSKWCEQEIVYFLKTHDRDHVLAVLAEGTPETSFSPYLLHTFDKDGNTEDDVEPLAANFVGKRKRKKEMVRIQAALIGCSFDSLWQREKRARTNRILALAGIVAAALAVFLGVVINKNTQITAKNAQISLQNQTLQRQMSATMVDQGLSRLELHDVTGALQNAAESFPEKNNLYDRRVEMLMCDALGAYRYRQIQSMLIDRQATEIKFAGISPDGSCLLTADETGTVRCIDIRSHTERWSRWTLDAEPTDQNNETLFFFVTDSDTVICKNTASILALSLQDGTVRWKYNYNSSNIYGTGNNYAVFSPDSNRLALADSEKPGGKPDRLVMLDALTGRTVGKTDLSEEGWNIELGPMQSWYYGGGNFTDDGTYIVAAVYEKEERDNFTSGDLQIVFHIINTKTFEEEHKAWITGLDPGITQILYGTHLIPEKQNLFCAIYVGSAIRTTVFSWDDMTSPSQITNKTLRSNDGLNYNLFGMYRVQQMLSDEKIALVFSDNTVFQYNRSTGDLLRSYEMKGAILNAWWIDRNKEIAAFQMDNGMVGIYDYEDGKTGVFKEYCVVQTDCANLRFAFPAGEPDEIRYILIPETAHEILETREITDPECEVITAPDFSYSDFSALCIPGNPSEAYMFCYGYEDTVTVMKMNLETGSVTAQQTYPQKGGSLSANISGVPLDADRFIQGYTIYHLNGDHEILPGVDEDKAYENWFCNIQLADGSAFTAEVSGPTAGRCWLNGMLVEEGDRGIGVRRMKPEGPLLIFQEADCFTAYNVLTNEYTVMENQQPAQPLKLVAQGRNRPIFACVYENGEILLYDTENDAVSFLESKYERGQIHAAAFADEDRILVILTSSGELTLYDMASNQEITSVKPEFDTGVVRLTHIRCVTDTERHRLHIILSQDSHDPGEWICMDMESWTAVARASNISTWLSGNNSLYAVYEGRLMRFPIHSLEELRAWTERELSSLPEKASNPDPTKIK